MRILFITATRVGDAVLSTGLLDQILRENPSSRVTIACGPAAAGLFEEVPGLEKIIILNKKPLSLHWVKLWLECVGCVWDVMVDLRNAPLSYLIPCREAWHLGRENMNAHRVERIAAAAGCAELPKSLKLWTSVTHQDKAKNILPENGPLIAIGPVASWSPKTWAPEKFVELFNRLTSDDSILPGAWIVVFGTESERIKAESLFKSLPEGRVIDLMGKLSLLEIQACLEKADIYIGNDSGLMHMAAAAGIPTLGLFGPSREQHYAPWGPNTMFVRGDLGYDELFPEDYDYRNSEKHDMMAGLSVDRACEATIKLWQQVRGRR